jgi:hypothetical protein
MQVQAGCDEPTSLRQWRLQLHPGGSTRACLGKKKGSDYFNSNTDGCATAGEPWILPVVQLQTPAFLVWTAWCPRGRAAVGIFEGIQKRDQSKPQKGSPKT